TEGIKAITNEAKLPVPDARGILIGVPDALIDVIVRITGELLLHTRLWLPTRVRPAQVRTRERGFFVLACLCAGPEVAAPLPPTPPALLAGAVEATADLVWRPRDWSAAEVGASGTGVERGRRRRASDPERLHAVTDQAQFPMPCVECIAGIMNALIDVIVG